jgi:hypothetical protein
MKYATVLLVFFFLISSPVTGQKNHTVTVKAGTRVVDYFSQSEQYRYPEFTQGKVSLIDGRFIDTKLNYCILAGEMQFLESKDTMFITNGKNIRYIQIMQDTFFYDNGYLEAISGHYPAIMAVKQYVTITDIKKEGPLGTRSSTSSTQSYSTIHGEGHLWYNEMVRLEDIVLSKKTDYYIGNSTSRFYLYTRKNLLKLFPQDKATIEAYLKNKDVDFKVKEDLIQLTEFLQEMK